MLLGMAAKDPTLAQVRPNGLNDTPQFKVNIDREKASALGVSTVGHRPDVLDRVGVAVCEQLPRRRRPDQEGLRAGRRAVPHERRKT